MQIEHLKGSIHAHHPPWRGFCHNDLQYGNMFLHTMPAMALSLGTTAEISSVHFPASPMSTHDVDDEDESFHDPQQLPVSDPSNHGAAQARTSASQEHRAGNDAAHAHPAVSSSDASCLQATRGDEASGAAARTASSSSRKDEKEVHHETEGPSQPVQTGPAAGPAAAPAAAGTDAGAGRDTGIVGILSERRVNERDTAGAARSQPEADPGAEEVCDTHGFYCLLKLFCPQSQQMDLLVV